MPRVTKKSIFIKKIFEYGINMMMELGSDDESECEDIQIEVENSVIQAYQSRNGEILKVPNQCKWLAEVLPSYDEGRFRQVTRVSYSKFNEILELIQTNPIFHDKNKLQFPVLVQLAVTLYRFGNYGTAASIQNVAKLFGVGDGSTVVRLTRRVIQAIQNLKNQFVFWPNRQERSKLEEHVKDILPGCIGIIDGTHIKLEEAPLIDSESYFDKNKNYSIQVQLVCDVSKRIRHCVIGYPGSCHDSRVWNECSIPNNIPEYLDENQFIAADKGYPLSKYVLTPFRDNSRDVSRIKRKQFNKYFSGFRVIIEHVNGILKETFSSLKELRNKIKDEYGHEEAVKWIESCIILYNIILPGDEVNYSASYDDDVPESPEVLHATVEKNEQGKARRIEICKWVNTKH